MLLSSPVATMNIRDSRGLLRIRLYLHRRVIPQYKINLKSDRYSQGDLAFS